MLGLDLVRPLEEDWRDTLDAVARGRRWPTSHDVAKLAAEVVGLSAAYNDARVARAGVSQAGPARLGFAFARDVPKGAAAVRELVATGALRMGPSPLRVLDLGAGLGASTWGLVRALEASGGRGPVEATFWDTDARALELAVDIARDRLERGARSAVSLRVTMAARPLGFERLEATLGAAAPFDVVLVGQVLSELDVGVPEQMRVNRHAGLLGSWLGRWTGPNGSLVVIEPALRDRTRHLHRVRDALVGVGATVFAPCLHAGACPALAGMADWCHEDVAVDLPGWLAPVARAAGLRRQGLTFSYLILRTDGTRLADALSARPGAARLRVVSEPLRTKGKRDVFVCGELPSGPSGSSVAARVRVTRLDRDGAHQNAAWQELGRGDVVVIDPAPDAARPRVGPVATVSRLGDGESR